MATIYETILDTGVFIVGRFWFLLNLCSSCEVNYRSYLLVNDVGVRLPSVMISHYHLSFEHS